LQKDILYAMAQASIKLETIKSAFAYFQQYSDLREEMLNTESIKKIADMQIRYETEKLEKERKVLDIKLLEQTEKNRRQLILLYFGLLVLALVSFFLVYIKRQNNKIKRAYELLEQSNKEILAQKEEIAAQRDSIQNKNEEIAAQRDLAEQQRDTITLQKQKITDSIEYASRIQAAVLTPTGLSKTY
jgi:hypothetical protein